LSPKNALPALPALLQLLFRTPLPAVAPQPLAVQFQSEKLAEKYTTANIDIPMFLLLRKSF